MKDDYLVYRRGKGEDEMKKRNMTMKVNGKKASYKKCMKKIRSLEKNARQLSLNFSVDKDF